MTTARWLDENEQRTWRTFMVATKLLYMQLERELDQASKVPSEYYEVLVRLSEAADRRLRLSELADQSQSSRSRLSHSLSRLESLGWIRREACASDRRGAFAVLTEEGFAALDSAAPIHVEGVRTHLFDVLDSEQLAQLRSISERLLEHQMSLKGSSSDMLKVLGVLGACPSRSSSSVDTE